MAIPTVMVVAVWSFPVQAVEPEENDPLARPRETSISYEGSLGSIDLSRRSSAGRLFDRPDIFSRDTEARADSVGEWGIAARYRSRSQRTEINLYWLQSGERPFEPRPALAATGPSSGFGGEATAPYPEGVRLLGAGIQANLHKASLGSDLQVQRDAWFESPRPEAAAGKGEPQEKLNYMVSSIARVRLSAAYALPATALWESATVRLNFGRQRVASLSRNAVATDPSANRTNQSVQLLFIPAWTEVLPNLDVSLPISLSYSARAQAPLPGLDKAYKGGQFSIGASAVYQKDWNANLRYMHYLEAPNSPYKDRNFLWLSIQRSF